MTKGQRVSLPEDDIERVLENAQAKEPNSKFVASIINWWETKGFLTEDQFVAVKRIAEK